MFRFIPINSARRDRHIGVAAVIALGIVAAALPSGAALADRRPSKVDEGPRDQVVIGTGRHAVYVGPAPVVGGDPAHGETEESYYARTGRHLPGRSATTLVDGPWWYGQAPAYGGDPASGETEDSYYARTGRHLGR